MVQSSVRASAAVNRQEHPDHSGEDQNFHRRNAGHNVKSISGRARLATVDFGANYFVIGELASRRGCRACRFWPARSPISRMKPLGTITAPPRRETPIRLRPRYICRFRARWRARKWADAFRERQGESGFG
jgi:hypothetical protein